MCLCSAGCCCDSSRCCIPESLPRFSLEPSVTLLLPLLQLAFKDEVLGFQYELVVFFYGHESPLTSPGFSHGRVSVRRGTQVLQQTDNFNVF